MTRPPSSSLPFAGLMLTFLFAGSCAPAPEVVIEPPKVQLTVKNFSAPFDWVVCSGQPTEEEFDSLKDAGVSRVIHLRLPKEKGTGWEEERAAKSGVEFVRFEINGKADLTKEKVKSFTELLNQHQKGATLVSCGSSNRVGALFALKAFWIDNLPKEEALAIGRKSGMTRLAATVEELIGK